MVSTRGMSGSSQAEGPFCSLLTSPFGAFPHVLTPWFSFLGEKRLQREKAEQALDNPEDLRGPSHFPVLKQGRSPYKRSFDEGDLHPQAKKKKIDLIFKDVLEASLESANAEGRQLALSTSLVIRKVPKYQDDDYGRAALTQGICRTPGEGDWKVPQRVAKELGPLEDEEEEHTSFKADSPAEASLASDPHELPTTSFCPNCIRLKKKVRELQAELDMLKSGKVPEPPILPQQVLELPEFSDPAGKLLRMRSLLKGRVCSAAPCVEGGPELSVTVATGEQRSATQRQPPLGVGTHFLRCQRQAGLKLWGALHVPTCILINKIRPIAGGLCAVFLTCCFLLGRGGGPTVVSPDPTSLSLSLEQGVCWELSQLPKLRPGAQPRPLLPDSVLPTWCSVPSLEF